MTSELGDAAWRQNTQMVRGGLDRSGHDETSEALYLTSGFVYQSAEEAEAAFKGDDPRYIYSRYGNPTVSMFEERLRILEGADACMATASGMAAIYASLACQLSASDRVVASRALFGSCLHIVEKILPQFGVETVTVDGTDLDAWEQALSAGAQAVFLETPSNPTLEILDIQAISDLAHNVGATVVVDNVFATPLHQRPLDLGADVVAYSATKHIDGQGRCLGGAILGSDEFITDKLMPFYRHTGPSMSPFNAWVLVKGLETLAVRVDRHVSNSQGFAEFAETLPGVRNVIYPGLKSHPQFELAAKQMSAPGTVVSVDLDGGKDKAFELLNALKLIDISNNLGDSKSLVTHPATTTHSKLSEDQRKDLGIGDGLIRISIGLEDIEDLKEDFANALGK